MKTLLIHVGPHKTASTYVQSTLVQNDARLRRAGLCYPETFRAKPGHHDLVTRLTTGGEEGFEALREELAPYPRAVISSENLTKLEPAQIARMLALLDGWDVHVLFCHRSAHEVWPSHWQETVKQGSGEDWPAYLDRATGRSDAVYARHMRPRVVLDRWSDGVGRDRLHVFPYAAIPAEPEGALAPLRDLIGLETAALARAEGERNAAYPAERIEAIRALNRHNAAAGGKIGSGVRRRYMRRAAEIEASAPFAALRDHLEMRGSCAMFWASDPHVAEVTDRVVARYGDRLMRPLPERERDGAREVRYVAAETPVPEPVVAALAALLGPEL